MPGDSSRWPPWQLGVRKDAAHQDAARGGIDLVVDEVDGPLVREALLALQAHEDGHLGTVLGHLELPFVDCPAVAQQGGLVHLEVDVHRVHRHDRGQERLVLVDQVAEGLR